MQTVSRLKELFQPTHYALSLTLNRTERTYQGTVTISGATHAATTEIRLHQKDLTIASVTFDGKEAHWTIDNGEVVITHPDLIEGEHIVVVVFTGTITDDMHGMYPCYFEHNGIKKELIATQFESHHAREVFPCIDEPGAKATFDVTLTTETDVTVLGNMPIKQQSTEHGALVTTFDTTPIMSTYLLAWVVGELHKASGTTNGGVEVNIWATPAQPVASLQFALDIATRTIDFFDDYFETPYPLPKSDHIALPDFSSGAMENWGLITYREVALLADPVKSGLDSRQQVALVIAHELSHQWFGNLVTMEWWNDLWLNESFANIMEYVAIDALQPDWRIWLDYSTQEVVQALRRDSLDGVQAIQSDVSHPDEISSLFDPSIVYAKGSRILRMLQTYIGEPAMQAGLKVYFQRYAYKNTVADDLWSCLSEASGLDVTALMHAWITQPGFPVVSVEMKKDTISLQQEQFFIGEHNDQQRQWPIPLASSDDTFPAIFDRSSLELKTTAHLPVSLNVDSASHYITQYDEPLRELLLAALPTLSDIDRLSFLNEQLLLAQANRIPSATLIEILEYFREETIEAVWGMMSLAINELKKFVDNDAEAETALRAFAGTLAASQYERLGLDKTPGEPESDTKLRSIIVGLMLYSERQEVIDAALKRYTDTTLDKIDPDLRAGIIANAVRQKATPTIIEDLLEQHRQTASSELQEDITAGLTASKDTETIDLLLSQLKNKEVIRRQDMPRWFVWLLRNRYGREQTWQWARDSWEWIAKTFGGDKSYDVFPRYIASCLSTQQQLEEYIEFFEPFKNDVALKRNIAIGKNELSARIALLERDGVSVRQALLDL